MTKNDEKRNINEALLEKRVEKLENVIADIKLGISKLQNEVI